MEHRWLVLVSTSFFVVGCSLRGDPEPVPERDTEAEGAGAALRPVLDPTPNPELTTSCRERCAPQLDDPYYGDHNYAVCLCRCTSPTRPPWSCGEYM